ncbi:MAG TPA: serine/threonine-protein kinase [Candidatus Angelobacter sp.]
MIAAMSPPSENTFSQEGAGLRIQRRDRTKIGANAERLLQPVNPVEGNLEIMAAKLPVVYASAFREYTVIKNIGNGGSGVVLEVADAEGKHFALKVIAPEKTSTQKLKRFQNEIAFCQKNAHPNIIAVLDYGRSPNKEPFYVMDLFDMTLEKAIYQTIPPGDILRVFGQLLNGVEAAHLKHVTHRDLKPQNVLCDSRQNAFVIADFGIASFEEDDLHTAVETRDNERLANFQYAAPEQRARGREITSKADIYALGLILNEMFTKEIPQGTGFKSIGSVQADYAYLDGIIDQMIRQDPSQRPDILEVKKQLLGRRNEFISLQKVDSLTKQVVPEEEIDDALIRDPLRIVDVDYRNRVLTVALSQTPSPGWIEEFKNQGNYSSFSGYEPYRANFFGTSLQIGTPSGYEQQQINYLKTWISNATNLYRHRLEREAESRKRLQQRALEQEISAERERQNVLKKISW